MKAKDHAQSLAAAVRALLPLVPFNGNHEDETTKGPALDLARKALREYEAAPYAGKVLRLSGRRWFGGNTYFSAVAALDGEVIATIEYEYGYGDHWRERIMAEAIASGKVPAMTASDHWPRAWAEKHGIELHESVTDVKRKRDL